MGVPAVVEWGEGVKGLGVRGDAPEKFQKPRPLDLRETPFFIIEIRSL